MTSRREFLTTAAAAFAAQSAIDAAAPADPWYRRTCRWGQTNITEKDPARYDIPWWREFWKRTAVQGVPAGFGNEGEHFIVVEHTAALVSHGEAVAVRVLAEADIATGLAYQGSQALTGVLTLERLFQQVEL